MNSQDGSMRPSQALEMFGGKIADKPKRRRVSRKNRSQERLTPSNPASREHPSVTGLSVEERIQLYMKRAEQGKLSKKPVNIFTGELYTKEELEVIDED